MPLPICSEPKYQDQLDKFLKDWPLSRVRTMPLTDYTRVNKDGESFRGSFCYALEQETPIGIGGGNAMKFGIYEFRRPSRMANALQDDRYAWNAELGKTAEEAFETLRFRIMAVIEASQSGDYAKLDSIILPSLLKWKTAFLYRSSTPKVGTYAATGCTAGEPLGHLGNPVREFTIDPKDKSKISLKILHFPLPVG